MPSSRIASRPFVAARAVLLLALFGLNAGGLAGVATAQPITFTSFQIPSSGGEPFGITAGPDGNVWFDEEGQVRQVGRITPTGDITMFDMPAGTFPNFIAAGPDGNLWSTGSDFVDRITTAGVLTGHFSGGLDPFGIVAGPDGNLWVAYPTSSKIGRMSTAGVLTSFPIPAPAGVPGEIAVGSDGNLWFTDGGIDNVRRIGRITTAGVITMFPIPTVNAALSCITPGPDGNLWFSEGTKIGRITTAGVITEFPLPSSPIGSTSASHIVTGPDGNLWFTERGLHGEGIGRMTTAGVLTEFIVPGASVQLEVIALGPDGNLWFTDFGNNKIFRLSLVHGPNVNDLVRLDSLASSCTRTPVNGGPAGSCTIHARFTNTSTFSISSTFFQVAVLSGGNLLLNADGGPGGVGAHLTANAGPDGIWSPAESINPTFVIGLQAWRSFSFNVDVMGDVGP